MKYSIVIFLLFPFRASFSSGEVATTARESMALDRVKAAMRIKVGDLSSSQELRLSYLISPNGLCGADGPTVIATLQIRRSSRPTDPNANLTAIVESFEDIKAYGVPLAEALKGNLDARDLMADDECRE